MSFRRIFPQRGRLMFDGGKNNQYDKQFIEDNQSPDCKNVIFDNGSVATRDGFAIFNTTAIGSFAGDGLFTRRNDAGTETMVAFAGGSMYTLGGTSTFTSVASAQSVFTAGVQVFADMQENYLFICNGSQIPHKWDGSIFTRHGVYPPTTTHSVASGAAGSLTGEYRYKVTCLNTAVVESDVGPANATFTITAGYATLTSLPTFAASFGINARKIYRTVAGGSTFKLLTTINDNTTTTYSDQTADASLGANAPTDNGVPPNYTAIKYHQNRLFFLDPANSNYLWFTNLADPYTVASTNFIKMGDNTSDLMKGIGVWQNNIVVFGERSVFLVYMSDTDPANWRIIRTQSQYGTKSPKCILDINNLLMFPAVQNGSLAGFSMMNGVALAQSTTFLTNNAIGSDRISDPIYPDILNIQRVNMDRMTGITFDNKAWISVTYGTSQTTNNRMYQLDYREHIATKKQAYSWVPFTSAITANDFTVYGGNLYFISAAANGYVYKAEAGAYSDNGTAIDSYFWTKEYACIPGEEDLTKDFRHSKILVGLLGDWMMNVKYRSNDDLGDGDTQQFSLNPGGSLWGTMVWGVDTWGGGTLTETIKVFLRGKRGDRIQFRFDNQNTVNQAFKVLNQDIIYNTKGLR